MQIMVVVEGLTKMAHFIDLSENAITEDVLNIFLS